jgi:hypothetical protein
MIKLRLKFKNDSGPIQEVEIEDGEILKAAVERALTDVPLGKYKEREVFLVTVNGLLIAPEFWEFTALKKTDDVIISPKISSGDSGQLFKTAALIVVAVVASYFLGPEAGAPFWEAIGSSLAVAAVTIGAALLLNALIPPPAQKLGDLGSLGGDINNSQMYSISGQSNQVRRYETVPKVYGTFRMFPNIAAIPYTELSASPGTQANFTIGDIYYQAVKNGVDGNKVTIVYQSGGTAGSETVTVSGTYPNATVTIKIAPGVSTAAQVLAALAGSPSALAVVSPSLAATVSTGAQSFVGSIKLLNGSDGGETIQYLYAIYDFGLGTNIVDQLTIGDTPLNSSSFDDFHYNLVDPARGVAQDQYDESLQTEFQYYKSQREITSLAVALDDTNAENIQVSDVNPDGVSQEIILDFICSKGLFSFSSGGTMGNRNILLEVEFAKVGTTDWRAYNDVSYVSTHEVVGGNDVSAVPARLVSTVFRVPNTAQSDAYYSIGSQTNNRGSKSTAVYIKGGTKDLLLANGVYPIGSKVFVGKRLLGVIQSVNTFSSAPNVIVTLDRVMTTSSKDILAYTYDGSVIHPVSLRIDNSFSASAVIIGKSTSAVYGSVRFTPIEVGQFQVRVRRAGVSGDYTTQTADSLTWAALTTVYATNPVATTKRHTFLELKIRATDQLNGNISTLSGICTSVLPIYDSVSQTFTRGPTSNPAWIFCDLLTGEVNKKSVPASKLDMDSIVEWAEFCDEIPTPPSGQTFTEPRFSCNFILDYQSTLQDVLASVGGASQASLNIINGKYGVLIDKLRTVPVQVFTPRNSKDFASNRVYSPKPDAVNITWIDPAIGWNTSEVTVYDNDKNLQNSVTHDELTSFGCINQEQAWRFGRYMIAQNRLRQETISLTVDFEMLACTRGDYVQITQDVMQVGGIPARVKAVSGNHITIDDSMDIDPAINYGYVYRNADDGIQTSTLTSTAPNQFIVDGGVPAVGDLIVIGAVGQIVLDCIVKAISPNDDLSATLALVEKADAIYDYESTNVLPDYDPQISVTSLPDVAPPLAVQNLTISDAGWLCSPLLSGIDYYATLTWDMPFGSVFELFEIWVNDGTGYRSIATTKIKTYTYFVSHDRLGIQHGFKVVAVSATGKKLQLISMPEVVTIPSHKTTPPGDVASLNMSITNQVLQLSWPALDDCSVDQYVLRYSPQSNDVWEASVPLMSVHKNVTSVSVQARTGIYFIKAIDTEGNVSVNAAEAITTIPDLIDINIIDTLNDAPSFPGEFDSTELLGSAVILSEQVHGDQNSVVYYDEGYYTYGSIFDLGDIFSVRLQSLIRADGYKKGELMSDWTELDLVDHLNTTLHSDWNIALQYRASDTFEAMADWAALNLIDHINSGAGIGFTGWRDIPTTGDATGRVLQFRAHMESLAANVTPRLFDATVQVDMPDRLDSFDNHTSDAVNATEIDFDPIFAGPSPAPNIQVSIDNAQSGDYWTFDSKTLAGVRIRFYDKTGIQVVRQFDLVAKGYGRQHTVTL